MTGKHKELAPGDYRRLLPMLLHDADLIVSHKTPEDVSGDWDLDFAWQPDGGKPWRLSIRSHGGGRVRATTMHRIREPYARSIAKRGKLIRDRRKWGPE